MESLAPDPYSNKKETGQVRHNSALSYQSALSHLQASLNSPSKTKYNSNDNNSDYGNAEQPVNATALIKTFMNRKVMDKVS